MSGPESPSKQPELPKGMTARQLLDDVSEKNRADIAKSQGVSLQALDRFLSAEARKNRVSDYVSQAAEVSAKIKSETTERIESDVKAEQAVIRGLEEALRGMERRILSDQEKESIEKEAYELCDKPNEDIEEISASKAAGMRQRAVNLFKKLALSEALSEISRRGKSPDTIKHVVAALRDRGRRQNLKELSTGLYDAAREIEWGIANSPLNEVEQLISSYASGTMSPEQKDLVRRFVKYGKSSYISRRAMPDTEIGRFQHLLADVAQGYRKYGPHRTEVENVSGPAETYGSIQSGDRNSGYNRTGKARPHRDPSGGSGENW